MKNRLFGVLRRARSVCAPKNAGKRIFSAFLSVCVAVSALTVSAFAIAEAAFYTLGSLIMGFLISYSSSEAADVIGQGLGDFGEAVRDFKGELTAANFTENSVVCQYQEWNNTYRFYVPSDSGLSESDQELAQFICDYYNENFEEYNYSATQALYYGDKGDHVSMEAKFYEKLKTGCYNALNSYLSKKIYNEQHEQSIDSISDLENALGDSFPRYDFDFVGPIPSLTMITPTMDGLCSLVKDGFTFTPSVKFSPGQGSFTKDQVSKLASYSPIYLSSSDDTYLRTTSVIDRPNNHLYGFNYYFLTDDGSLYFSTFLYDSSGNIGSFAYPLNSATNSFYDVSGKMISNISEVNEIKSHISSVGVVLNTGNQLQSSIPINVKDTLTDEDFITTSGGEAISKEIPRTDIENIIGGAIGMGLIGADAPLTIGADGTITAADGIPIEKLGEITEAIASGNLNLDSIEEYLSLISTLVGNGNLTMTEQQKILENIGAYAGAFAGDISEIKDILKEWAKAAEAEAAAENLDYDLPDVTIIDKFPFSLPFDVYYVLDLLCAEPKKPIFTIPIKTTIKIGNFRQSIDEKIVLDLTIFKIGNVDMVQAFINSVVTISFVFALIAGTRKFIWK